MSPQVPLDTADQVSVVDVHLLRVRVRTDVESMGTLFRRYHAAPTADGLVLADRDNGRRDERDRARRAAAQRQLATLPHLAQLLREGMPRATRVDAISLNTGDSGTIAAETALLATVYDQPTRHRRDVALRMVQAGFTGAPQDLVAALDAAEVAAATG